MKDYDDPAVLFQAVPWYMKIVWVIGVIANLTLIGFLLYMLSKFLLFLWSALM